MRGSRGARICVLLSLIGIGLCGYLIFLHLALLRGELAGGVACGASGTVFNCHAVTASPFGSLFGVPLSYWGLIGYLATFSLAFVAWQLPDWTAPGLSALVALSGLFVVADLVLLVIMVTQIRYLCPLCLSSYAVNLLLLLVSWWALAKPLRQLVSQAPSALRMFLPKPRTAAVWIVWGVVLTGAAGGLAVNAATTYLSQGAPGTLRKQMQQFASQKPRVQVTVSGDPMHGSADRPIQVVEFSDFLCPSCHRASKFNPIIVAGHRHEVAFVFKHFPIDQDCNASVKRTLHPGACQIAAATECAHEQGKFWALHDRIFEVGPTYRVDHLEQDAERAGLDMTTFRECLASGRGTEAVKQDIAEAARLGVNSTPTYIVNGLPMPGIMTPMVFGELLSVLRESE